MYLTTHDHRRGLRRILLLAMAGTMSLFALSCGNSSEDAAQPRSAATEQAPAEGGDTPPLQSSTSPAPSDAQFRLTRAKDFSLEIHGGGKARLSEQLERGPLILDFWATWCAPCKRAFPRYQELVRKYREHGVELWAVSQDDPRMYDKIGPYFESQGFDFPALLDPERKVARTYNVVSLPTTFILAPDGEVLYHHMGFRDGDEKTMERILRRSLGLEALDGSAEEHPAAEGNGR